jgi:hypothetical protein
MFKIIRYANFAISAKLLVNMIEAGECLKHRPSKYRPPSIKSDFFLGGGGSSAPGLIDLEETTYSDKLKACCLTKLTDGYLCRYRLISNISCSG